MRVALHTWGSEGDVRPFIALAEGLLAAGHQVRLTYCPADGRDYGARLAGARFEHRCVSLGQDPEALAQLGLEIFADRNPLRQLERVLQTQLEPVLGALAEAAAADLAWADVPVTHFMAYPLASAAAAAAKPFVAVHPTTMFATRAFPPPGLPDLGPLNGAFWALVLKLVSRKLAPSISRVRAGFGLPSLGHLNDYLATSALDVVAISPVLLPRPGDWPGKIQVSGFLSPRSGPGAALAPDLEAFLAQGAPPVYVTFGSMSAAERDPEGVFGVVAEAVAQAGCRAIVQAGPGPSTGQVLRVGPTAHDAVFPRCAAIVHHGGAGTTQAAMRSGRPSVVVPHFGDQFSWGKRLAGLGVAPPPVARHSLDAKRLARAMRRALGDEAMRRRADEVGRAMQAEDGVARAVELIAGVARR